MKNGFSLEFEEAVGDFKGQILKWLTANVI